MQNKKWARLLAYVTGLVNQQLLRQNEYLAAENRILRLHLPAHLRLSDPERSTLAEIGRRLWPEGAGEGGQRRPARHDPGVVPAADRPQVRRIQAPILSGPTAHRG